MITRIMAFMGLLAFAVTLIGGVISDNSLSFTISRALWGMLVFCALGLVLGWCAQRVVRECHHKQYEQVYGHPPDLPASAAEENSVDETSTPPTAQPINN